MTDFVGPSRRSRRLAAAVLAGSAASLLVPFAFAVTPSGASPRSPAKAPATATALPAARPATPVIPASRPTGSWLPAGIPAPPPLPGSPSGRSRVVPPAETSPPLAASVASALPAGVDAGWTIEVSRNPRLAQDGFYAGACASPSKCFAVGSTVNRAGAVLPFIESWDGKVWSVETTPTVDTPFGQLAGVSCGSPTSCVAVGEYTNALGVLTLVESWDGTSWAIQPSPNSPVGFGYNLLNAVSCTSPTACTAAGYFGLGALTYDTLIERWNGTAWTIESSPNASGAGETFLWGVSCGSSAACVATGFYEVTYAGASQAFTEVWNGSFWQVKAAAVPDGATSASLYGVSCKSSASCISAGYDYTSASADAQPLAESWNGTVWSVLPTMPGLPGAAMTLVDRVSCGLHTACLVIGYSVDSSGATQPLAESWDGSSWSILPTVDPIGDIYSYFTGVSCTSLAACTAVGDSQTATGANLTLAERWNGSVWKLQHTLDPVATTQATLNGVSCLSPTDCIAVGSYATAQGSFTLAESLTGTTWAVLATPDVPGTADDVLNSVSCLSFTDCIAVGYYEGSSGTASLAEAWDGSSWTIMTTTDPASAIYGDVLTSVSCTSASDCMAVGDYSDDAGTFALAEVWAGGSWAITPTSDPVNAVDDYLYGVSCTLPTSCVAVGSTEGPSNTLSLAETWDGSSWALMTTTDVPGAWQDVLMGVSCTSSTDCTAVGSYAEKSRRHSLAEAWDGTSWNLQTTADPGKYASVLTGISCMSSGPSTSCTAVGYYKNGYGSEETAGRSLAEAFDGTSWAVQNTPNPSGRPAALLGVSCSVTSACVAVGNRYNLDGTELSLAEAQLP
jgi:hypothetical protein